MQKYFPPRIPKDQNEWLKSPKQTVKNKINTQMKKKKKIDFSFHLIIPSKRNVAIIIQKLWLQVLIAFLL